MNEENLENEYYLIPTVVFYRAKSGQLHSKRIYCKCGEPLYGEHLDVVVFNSRLMTYKFGTLDNPYLIYECFHCGFNVEAEDATALRKAFVEDII
jgi:hypothetical protein